MTHYYLYIQEDGVQISPSSTMYKVAVGNNSRHERAKRVLSAIASKRGHYFRIWDDKTDALFSKIDASFENFLSRATLYPRIHQGWRSPFVIAFPLLCLRTLCKIGIAIISLLTLAISRLVKSSENPSLSPRVVRKNLSNMEERLLCKIMVYVYAILICAALIIKFIII